MCRITAANFCRSSCGKVKVGVTKTQGRVARGGETAMQILISNIPKWIILLLFILLKAVQI